MKFEIVAIGKIRQKFIKAGEEEYSSRLSGRSSLEILEIEPAEGRALTAEEIKQIEGRKILDKTRKAQYMVVLDECGKSFNSKDFAKFIQKVMNQGSSKITFVIGGAYGLSEEVKSRSNLSLSLSNLTFPYQLVRLVLVEQIYRATTLLDGKPYHK